MAKKGVTKRCSGKVTNKKGEVVRCSARLKVKKSLNVVYCRGCKRPHPLKTTRAIVRANNKINKMER